MASTPSTTSDASWRQAADHFRRWRAGNAAAIDHLVRSLTPVLWQVARAQRLSEDDAAEVVQTTWLALVRRPESVRDPAAVGAWLTTTARREAWRVSRRNPSFDATETEPPGSPLDSAEDEAILRLRDRTLWRAVSQLPDRCQRLMRVAAFLERPDYARLCDQLGMPIGSIGPTRGRCLARLRKLLEAEGMHHG